MDKMNSRRLAIALLLALAVSGAVTFVVSRKLTSRAATRSAVKQYVAAQHALQAGDVLKADDLVLVNWPESVALSKPFIKISDIVGRAVIYPLPASQPILEQYLAAAGSGIGLTTKIPEGMRATSVKSDEVVGVAGFLFPGSHVDVLVTFRSEGIAAPATQIVLQDVEVLTVGQKLQPDPQGKPENVNVVTLLLTPEDSQKLVLASSQGSIQFVLRNGADHTKVEAMPVQIAQLAGAPPAKPSATPVTQRPRLPMKPADVVETILGDKHTTRSFE
jgi:pilus assembly protein CpaB